MPKPRTKATKRRKVKAAIGMFAPDVLRSGSAPLAPIADDPVRAMAIAMRESGKGRKRRKGS